MARIKTVPTEPSRRSERIQVARVIENSKQSIAAKVNKPKRFRRKQQRKICHLLNLPGALRNRIYKYALVEHEEIGVTSKDPGEPSLLKVCRRIRMETSSIYYGDNNFKLYVEDYKGADLAPFRRYAARNRYKDYTSNITYGQIRPRKPNWDNLVAWLKAYDRCEVGVPDVNRAEILEIAREIWDSDDYIFSAALKIVDAMVWMPWSKKEEVLQAFYHGLKGTHSKWVKAEDRLPRWAIL